MRMRQSIAEIEDAFFEEIEEDRERREHLRRRAENRERKREADRRHRHGSMRFFLLVLVRQVCRCLRAGERGARRARANGGMRCVVAEAVGRRTWPSRRAERADAFRGRCEGQAAAFALQRVARRIPQSFALMITLLCLAVDHFSD